jgi:hypothetical protein
VGVEAEGGREEREAEFVVGRKEGRKEGNESLV